MTLVIGIDPSSAKVAATSFCDGELLGQSTTKLITEKSIACLNACLWIQKYIKKCEKKTGETATVFLEAPVLGRGGPGSTIPQAQVSGALLAGAGISGTRIMLVNNQTWKKEVCGKGNMNKDQITAWLKENHRDFHDFCIHNDKVDQDLVDSVCITLYGQKVMGMTERVKPGGKRVLIRRVKK